jgi:hypothetical protein
MSSLGLPVQVGHVDDERVAFPVGRESHPELDVRSEMGPSIQRDGAIPIGRRETRRIRALEEFGIRRATGRASGRPGDTGSACRCVPVSSGCRRGPAGPGVSPPPTADMGFCRPADPRFGFGSVAGQSPWLPQRPLPPGSRRPAGPSSHRCPPLRRSRNPGGRGAHPAYARVSRTSRSPPDSAPRHLSAAVPPPPNARHTVIVLNAACSRQRVCSSWI